MFVLRKDRKTNRTRDRKTAWQTEGQPDSQKDRHTNRKKE